MKQYLFSSVRVLNMGVSILSQWIIIKTLLIMSVCIGQSEVMKLGHIVGPIRVVHFSFLPPCRWQYFGSMTGMHRTFPGHEWSQNFIGFHMDYDPRTRPWYLGTVSGAKDVVIIVDGSVSMEQEGRYWLIDCLIDGWIIDWLIDQLID